MLQTHMLLVIQYSTVVNVDHVPMNTISIFTTPRLTASPTQQQNVPSCLSSVLITSGHAWIGTWASPLVATIAGWPMSCAIKSNANGFVCCQFFLVKRKMIPDPPANSIHALNAMRKCAAQRSSNVLVRTDEELAFRLT
jgi:hypothetical protein